MIGVYFLLGEKTNLVKIGFSVVMEQRIEDLQSNSPDVLRLVGRIACSNYASAYDAEQEVHQKLSGSREHREWFRFSGEVITHLHTVVGCIRCPACAPWWGMKPKLCGQPPYQEWRVETGSGNSIRLAHFTYPEYNLHPRS